MEGAANYNPIGDIIVMFNEKVEGAAIYNPIGLIIGDS